MPRTARAQEAPRDLTSLRLEDLMNLDVTSAAKKPQKLTQAPAAIFVIAREDIRRSGATDLPDLLRMVPGLEVAQINPSTWAITARGFNGQYSNKLLVLVDGRAVYNPIFSGVFWDEQDIPFDLIERIEIIRGPGAAVWGVNAVNGVINIILKPAVETESTRVALSTGTQQRVSGAVRYGSKLGSHGAYRVNADGLKVEALPTLNHQDGKDDWHLLNGGFQLDEDYSPKDSFTVEGETARGVEGAMATAVVSLQPPVTANLNLHDHFSGWDLLARWKHTSSAGSETSLQTYYWRDSRVDSTFGGGLNTLDFDFQQHANLPPRQDFVWGLGYRRNSDRLSDYFRLSFRPRSLRPQIFSAFVQDEISLVPNRLALSLGARLQHDDYNGFNLQPTAQLTWSATERAMVWAQVSQAERIPSRAETALRWNLAVFPGSDNLPALASIFGNPNQKNERLKDAEAGLRRELWTWLSLDATAYFNQYRDLASVDAGAPRIEADPQPVHTLYPFTYGNNLHGATHGLEIFGHLKLASRWTLSPGYTLLCMDVHANTAQNAIVPSLGQEGENPTDQAQLRSFVKVSSRWEWSSAAYYVGRLSASTVPSYTRLDSQLSFHATDKLSFALTGQNLLKNLHQEYGDSNTTVLPNLIRRSAYFKFVWRP